MLVATQLGIYEQGTAPGSVGCGQEGKDFICDVLGGIYSCRACDYPQLEQFKGVQHNANRLVKHFGLSKSLLLDVDGRIGPLTTATVAAVYTRARGYSAELPNGGTMTPEWIAKHAEEIHAGFQRAADMAGAPQQVPEAPTKPVVSSGGSQPATIPPSTPPGITLPGRPGMSRGKKAAIAALALFTAVGLVGTGVYYYRQQGF